MTKHSAVSEELKLPETLEGDDAAVQSSEAEMLPLDGDRIITLNVGKKVHHYRFRRLTIKDWQIYFGSIVHKTIQLGGERESIFETESAQLELIDRTLEAVTGYGDTSKLNNWKRALPVRHRLAASQVLRSVGPSAETGEDECLSELIEVKLDAAWSSNGETGKTTFFAGLVHRFRQPSTEQLRKFNFETARVRIQGTAQDGITSYPSRHLAAMNIYDELIESVEGYSLRGVPLATIEEIKREMDGAHKAEAATALFTQGDEVSVK